MRGIFFYVVVGRVYWLEFDKGGKVEVDRNSSTRVRPACLPHSTRISFPYRVVTRSFRTHRYTSDTRTQTSYLLSTAHTDADARAHPHIHTLTHATARSRYLRPPPFIQSHHAFSLAQYLLIPFSIYCIPSRSLPLSLILALFVL